MVRALALRGKSLLRQTNTAPHVVFGMQGIKINLEAIITWLKKKKELPNWRTVLHKGVNFNTRKGSQEKSVVHDTHWLKRKCINMASSPVPGYHAYFLCWAWICCSEITMLKPFRSLCMKNDTNMTSKATFTRYRQYFRRVEKFDQILCSSKRG